MHSCPKDLVRKWPKCSVKFPCLTFFWVIFLVLKMFEMLYNTKIFLPLYRRAHGGHLAQRSQNLYTGAGAWVHFLQNCLQDRSARKNIWPRQGCTFFGNSTPIMIMTKKVYLSIESIFWTLPPISNAKLIRFGPLWNENLVFSFLFF